MAVEVLITVIVLCFAGFCYSLKGSKKTESFHTEHRKVGKDKPGDKVCALCGQKSVHSDQTRCTNVNCRGKMIKVEKI
jgi:hypothetical protein